MQDVNHSPKPKNPIDPLKEPLKGTLIDPFKGALKAGCPKLQGPLGVLRVCAF